MFDGVLTLITETTTTNALGFPTSTETRTDVLCKVRSVGQSEYFNAREAGLASEFVFDVAAAEYSGQRIAEYEGTKYGIYRPTKDLDTVELYAEYKGGLIDG